jgi:hypothetical protein
MVYRARISSTLFSISPADTPEAGLTVIMASDPWTLSSLTLTSTESTLSPKACSSFR